MAENGKGDTPRPIVVDQETFKKNWAQTFGGETEAQDVDSGNSSPHQ
jgi:hypothetical protein